MEKKLKRVFLGIFVIMGMFLLNGCVAAIPLMMAAQAGLAAHTVTKTVQMSTDGDVIMAIGENEIANQPKGELVLANISRLALWPDDEMVAVANNLHQSGAFATIATPRQARKALEKAGFDQSLAGLTHSEKTQAFKAICKQTNTEAIVVFEDLGNQMNMRMWSFSRSSVDFKGKITIYALGPNRIIYSSIAELSIELGGSHNKHDIMAKAGKLLADRIVALKVGTSVAAKTE